MTTAVADKAAMRPGWYWCRFTDDPTEPWVLSFLTGYGTWRSWKWGVCKNEPKYISALRPPE
jgi:hypothetical protein